MSKKDTISKDYMSDNDKFADAFNYYIYNGKQIIKPENLKERDITEFSFPHGNNESFFAVEKYRDILKKCVIRTDEKYIYLLLGIENQSDIHYAMPVRNMLYDALNYSEQISDMAKKHRINKDKMESAEFLSGITKEDRLIPVITLVIYWGSDDWDAPRSLYEMLCETDLDTLQFVSDYHLNLIVPKEIKDFSMFQSEIGKVLEFINASEDVEKMKEILEENKQYYLHMDMDSARMIEEFGNTKIDIDRHEGEEEINMCKAIDDMIQEAVEEKETEMCKAIDGMIQEAVEEKETEMCKAIDDMIQEAVEEKEMEMCKAIDDMVFEGEQRGIQKGIRTTIEVAKEYGATKEEVVEKIKEKYALTDEKAKRYVDEYYL